MKIRKAHRYFGLLASPFLLAVAVTGALLLARDNGIYSKRIKSLLVGVHNWEIFAPYIGIVLAFALFFMLITGLILFFNRKA